MATKDKAAEAEAKAQAAQEEADAKAEEAAQPAQSPLGVGQPPRTIPDLDARYRAAGVDPNKFED